MFVKLPDVEESIHPDIEPGEYNIEVHSELHISCQLNGSTMIYDSAMKKGVDESYPVETLEICNDDLKSLGEYFLALHKKYEENKKNHENCE